MVFRCWPCAVAPDIRLLPNPARRAADVPHWELNSPRDAAFDADLRCWHGAIHWGSDRPRGETPCTGETDPSGHNRLQSATGALWSFATCPERGQFVSALCTRAAVFPR